MDRVNDFAFKIATANGTGSASANGLIMQAIFRMGIPVTGRTSSRRTSRACPPGTRSGSARRLHRAHPALRPDGGAQRRDLRRRTSPRCAVRRLAALRLDVAARRAADAARRHLPRRAARRAVQRAAFKGVRERILMKNIAYAGALAALLDIDTEIIRALLTGEVRARSRRCSTRTDQAVALGYDYAKEHFACPLPIRLERDGRDQGLDPDRRQHRRRRSAACIAGATVGAWYPITPATSLMEALQELLPEVPRRPGDEEEPLRDPPGRGRAGRRRAW